MKKYQEFETEYFRIIQGTFKTSMKREFSKHAVYLFCQHT